MDVQIASLCDAAADYNGKLSLLGAFDTVLVQQVPAVHPHCSVALRIVFRDTDEGDHTLQLAMIDEDGKNLLPKIEAQIKIKLAENMYFSSNNLIFNLQGLQFPSLGQYSIDIRLDEKIIARIPLQVLKIEPGKYNQPPPAT
ncbi:MAG: hypothetical protein ISQ14_10975 [Verrucomicrobiae bacterium]|jgi:hypothetical protein|nr:hypothetical protein [Verrucomicrobiae bacterium]